MSKFSIVPGNVQAQMGVFESCSTTLKDLSGQIDSVGQGLNSALAEMKPALDALSLRTSDHSVTMQKYGLVLGRAVKFYTDSDNHTFNNIGTGNGAMAFKTIEVKAPVNMAAAPVAAAGTVTRSPGREQIVTNPRAASYDDLMEELKDYIHEDEIIATSDGYFIIDVPFNELLKRAGISENEWPDLKYYDDWYLSGYKDQNGNMIYALLKARELGDDQSAVGWGTGLSFIPLDAGKLTNALNNPTDAKIVGKAFNNVDKIVHSGDHPFSGNLTMAEYFNDPNSEGSYLIADFLVDKAAQQHLTSGVPFEIPYTYDQVNEHCQSTLDYLAQQGIYDRTNNTITIANVNNMTEDERRAVLMLTTGDPDKYAFAAENQYHAWHYLWDPFTLSHTVMSDANMGEVQGYEWKFKTDDGSYYQQQYEAHGGQ